MVLRWGTLNKPNTHSICSIEYTIIHLKIMCLGKHTYLRYFIEKILSYQEIVSEGKFVHTISCSCRTFTNISSLNRHIIFVELSHYGIFLNMLLGICRS